MQKDDEMQEAEHDYSAVARHRGFGARIMSDASRQSLREFTANMAIEYDFDDVDLLYSFLVRMWLLMDVGSAVTLIDGRVAVPADQPKFKGTQEQLQRLYDCLREAAEIMRQAPENETLAASLHFADTDGRMDAHFASLLALEATSREAAHLEGRAGRPANEDWIKEFCIACQHFWEMSGMGGTAIDFRTAQKTPITRWVEAVYLGLRRMRGERDDLNKLKSSAKDIPAYRPEKNTV